MDLPFYREYELPWTLGAGREKKFQRLLGIVFLVALALSLVWPFIPTSEPDLTKSKRFRPASRNCCSRRSRHRRHRPTTGARAGAGAGPSPRKSSRPSRARARAIRAGTRADRTEVAREQAQAAFMPFAEDLADLVDQDLLRCRRRP